MKLVNEAYYLRSVYNNSDLDSNIFVLSRRSLEALIHMNYFPNYTFCEVLGWEGPRDCVVENGGIVLIEGRNIIEEMQYGVNYYYEQKEALEDDG